MGEFQGDDAGSVVSARLRGRTRRLTHYSPTVPGETPQPQSYTPFDMPLEALVEHERLNIRSTDVDYDSTKTLWRSMETGQHLLRRLRLAGGRAAEAEALFQSPVGFQLPESTVEVLAELDAQTSRRLKLLSSKVPDGVALYAEVQPALLDHAAGGPLLVALLASLGLDTMDEALLSAVVAVLSSWATWYRSSILVPEDDFDALAPASSAEAQRARLRSAAWRPSRMEYQFSVAAADSGGTGEETVLVARDYWGGHLDWYSFDHASANLAGPGGATESAFVSSVYPVSVKYRGMPSPRFWELEDGDVNLGGTGTSPEDLTGMLLTEFALTYGDDWSVIPLKLPIGSLTWIDSLVVTDCFGVRTLIRPAKEAAPQGLFWRMFEASADGREDAAAMAKSFLFLPPSLPRVPSKEPIEKVLFLRDEGANMAWGVEERVEASGGGYVNRGEIWRRTPKVEPDDSGEPAADLRYLLNTTVPDYWFPLMPTKIPGGGGEIVFTLGKAPASDVYGVAVQPMPQGRILAGLEYGFLREEELPREGIEVLRAYQSARWVNGKTFVWIGRQKRVGKAEGSSGLRWDCVRVATS